jgi:predicted transposase/invertase (TIGR01784 family)
MQSSGSTHYKNRALYYWSKLYASQIQDSIEYEKLLPTIGIHISDFTLFPELPEYHNYFVITEGELRRYALTDHLIIHFLEIPKIKDHEMSSKIKRWLLYLKSEGRDKEMLKVLLESDEDLKSAHEMYKAFNEDVMLREHALAREKTRRDNLHMQNMAMKEGLEKGLEKGIEEGRLEEKHALLIRLFELKYTLSEDERNHILSVTDFVKLDAALDAFVFAEEKESVLKLL